MILIADGGSTKTSWVLLNQRGRPLQFETEGYHPFFVDSAQIRESLGRMLPAAIQEKAGDVTRIFFYSAGGGYSPESDDILIQGISAIFRKAAITIETDLLAAARALLGEEEGFAAILGTGANSCIYNGKEVVANIESLGFLLGDEGSGSYIGKKLIGDYIREVMPKSIRDAFYQTYHLGGNDLLNRVYEHPVANRYCASFARFAGDHLHEDPYYEQLVMDAFRDFFRNIVASYPNYQRYSFNCVGSIAYHFRELLEKVIIEQGMIPGVIDKDPMQGLIEYHRKDLKRLN
ncbi:BadF/BadG/BcrA/BcrD ATPase family protein [Petrimonas sp.]|jgi:glucosamine kinase|uniref:BadF/BadG/BcrA/BcrD ATPase family protein n=1 Tax=Petrimonas sp. TaxID=2023866 RepID=UPI002B25D1CE|nr:BadF/BadG/BcrA/BcrD ATPase family protein [Petrimonas sp.]